MKTKRTIYVVLLGLNIGLIVGEAIFGSHMWLMFVYGVVAAACAIGIVSTEVAA